MLRHQLRRKSPKRLAFSNFDRLVFAGLYRISPRIENALVIVKAGERSSGGIGRVFSVWRWKSRSRGGRARGPARNVVVFGERHRRHTLLFLYTIIQYSNGARTIYL